MEKMKVTWVSPDGRIRFFEGDCLIYMKSLPDKFYGLAWCDSPYGIGEDGGKNGSRSKIATSKDYKSYQSGDNESPSVEMWNEIFRVSKNQIIWGANHFISKIPYDSPAWIIWDKENGETDFADCELAWTSYDCAVRKFQFRWAGMLQQNMKNKQERIHPNEKPIDLIRWALNKYTQKGQKVFSPFGGGLGDAIGCDMEGFECDICENDAFYFNLGFNRFTDYYTKKTEIAKLGYAKTALNRINPTLF